MCSFFVRKSRNKLNLKNKCIINFEYRFIKYICICFIVNYTSMIFHSSPLLLAKVIQPRLICSHIAGMLNSPDHRIILMALKIAFMLVRSVPLVFAVHFRKEGILHRIEQIITHTKSLTIPNECYSSISTCLDRSNLVKSNSKSSNLDCSGQTLLLRSSSLCSNKEMHNVTSCDEYSFQIDTRQRRRSNQPLVSQEVSFLHKFYIQ